MFTKDVTLRINIKKVTWSTSFGQIIVQFEKQKNSAARFLLLLFLGGGRMFICCSFLNSR